MGLCLDRANSVTCGKASRRWAAWEPFEIITSLALPGELWSCSETSMCHHCVTVLSSHPATPWRTGVEPGHHLSLGPHPSVPHSRSSRDPHPRGPWPETPRSPEKLAPAGVRGVPGTFHLTFPLHLSILGPLHMNVYIRYMSFKFYSLYYLSFSFIFSIASMNKHHPWSALTPNPVAFTKGPKRHNHQPRERLD